MRGRREWAAKSNRPLWEDVPPDRRPIVPWGIVLTPFFTGFWLGALTGIVVFAVS